MNEGMLELPRKYDLVRFSHLTPQPVFMPTTEPYVSIPPALWIRDNENALWSLGFDYNECEWRSGRYEYDIVRNGIKTGDFGRVIEFRRGKVRIFTCEGWKTWNRRSFV